MKNKLYENLESIGTVLWLLTDFIWMCGMNKIAAIMTIPTMILLFSSCISYRGSKMSELYSLTASAGWLLMNSLWIYSELIEKDMYLLCAKFSFLFACIFVYLSFRASKKESGTIDFKRLKIK